jgi:hypothetical protein
MDKKSFDHIENKIREAADNSSQHPYEDHAWQKMEAKLDKNKKRRPFAWWALALPIVLVAGVGSMYWFNGNHGVTTNAVVTKLITDNGQQTTVSTTPTTNNYQPSTNNAVTTSTTATVVFVNATNNNNTGSISHSYKLSTHSKTRTHIKMGSQTDESNNVQPSFRVPDEPTNKVSSANIKGDSASNVVAVNTVKKTLIKKDTTASIVKTDDKKKAANHKFYLLAVAGADAADVNFMSFKNSTITARYGIGIGYQLSKKISIQTGFYAGRKKYIAGPGDYIAKDGYLSTVDITQVNANCMVYDIPVTVRYNFIQHLNTTYYATADLSSFIMKSEAYNYNYIDNNIAYQSSKTYSGNQNLFSILDLSIGIDKTLNNRFSLLLEPSVSIPVAGVGEGSVKLYSTSLLAGVKYNF